MKRKEKEKRDIERMGPGGEVGESLSQKLMGKEFPGRGSLSGEHLKQKDQQGAKALRQEVLSLLQGRKSSTARG